MRSRTWTLSRTLQPELWEGLRLQRIDDSQIIYQKHKLLTRDYGRVTQHGESGAPAGELYTMVLAMAPMAAMLRFVRSARVGAIALALLLPAVVCFGDTAAGIGVEANVVAQIDAGQFASATTQIGQVLAQTAIDAKLRESLEFQRERMRRILLDFTLSEDDVKARLRKQIPDLRDDEFAKWDGDGLLERRVIDGRVLYFSRSPSNLFRLSHEALAR